VIRAIAVAVASLFVAGWAMPPRAQLDHIVVAARSLDEGIAQFERLTGVTPTIGGKHPGRGTENALVSLGSGAYLEILAPQAGATLSTDDEPLRGIATLTIIDWAIAVPEVDAAVASLQTAGFVTSPPRPGARLTPSGERLDWMTFALPDVRTAPFFIRWSPNTRHPSTTVPSGCTLERFVVHDPDADRLTAVLRALGAEGIVVHGGPASVEAALACGSMHATIASAPG
jgi:hypothetical protein